MKLNVEIVKILIDGKDFNQRTFAEEIGITRTGLNLILNHKRNPSVKTVEKIAKALGVKVKMIMEEEKRC